MLKIEFVPMKNSGNCVEKKDRTDEISGKALKKVSKLLNPLKVAEHSR